jgi:hypothetical protein
MSVLWLRSSAAAKSVAALAFLHLSMSASALHAQSGCESAETVVTTCADWQKMHESFLQERKTRAITLEPEEGQLSGRLSGQAWSASNGDFPLFAAPAGQAVEMRTSLSKFGAYYARQDAEKIAKVEDAVPEGMELPEPATARSQAIDVWSSMKVEGLVPGSSREGLISHFGADYTMSKDVLVGASVEFEELEQASAAATAAGRAFMVGPYMATRLHDNLQFDARLAWGEGTDAVDADGAAARIETERRLAKARLEGDFDLAGWRVSSSAAFVHAREVPQGWGEGVTTNTLTLGPEMRRTFRIEDGPVIEPFLRYSNKAEIDAAESLSELDALSFEGSVGGGVTITMPDEYRIQATTEVESGEADTAPNVSGRLEITVPVR